MNDKTEQSVTDVLPCPFCGSTEGFYVVEGSTFRWRVISCRSCGEGTEVRHKNNSDEPDSYIADWNAAAPYPAMLRKEIDTLRAQLAEAQREAVSLAQTLFKRHYAQEPHYASGEIEWEPFNEPASVITQIDNMVAGISAQLAEAQRDAERLDWIIEHRAYVVSDPDCCDGYWLNYARPDGTMWTQATEHETPRAAIDAAKGESNG